MSLVKLKPKKVTFFFGLFLLLILAGFLFREYQLSTVLNSEFKYAMVYLDTKGTVNYVSFDPEEKQIFTLSYPQNLEIKSRSVGNYTIGKLYTLGNYEGNPGEFTRKKVQGFMRAPVMGYMVSDQPLKKALFRHIFTGRGTTLSRLDALYLYLKSNSYVVKDEGENDLLRAGAIEKSGDKFTYSSERLQQYLSTRVFDWGIGGGGVTAAVINQSGEDGLGRDIAQFLTNAGVDVVAVRGASEQNEKTKIVIEKDDVSSEKLAKALLSWFGYGYEVGDVSSYRARMVIYVGKDGLKLF